MFATQIGNPDPEDSIRIIRKALDAGMNLVDTAPAFRLPTPRICRRRKSSSRSASGELT